MRSLREKWTAAGGTGVWILVGLELCVSGRRLGVQSVVGLRIRMSSAHRTGVRIEFYLPALAKVFLQVGIVSGRGLVIGLLKQGDSQEESMDLSEATLDGIIRQLRSLAGEVEPQLIIPR